jgi:hypothetical protein
LAERSELWNAKLENRYLPSLWEFLNIRLLTDGKDWSGPQRKMMGKTGRHHGLCWATGLLLSVTLGIILQQYVSTTRLASDARRAESLVSAVLTAPADAVPYAIQNLEPLREHSLSILERQFENGQLPPPQRLHAAFALASFGRVERVFLVESIVSARPDECRNFIIALRMDQRAAVHGLRQQAERAGKSKDWPQRTRNWPS